RPARTKTAPSMRDTSVPRNAGRNSQCVIHHGNTPASVSGTTTKNSPEPKIATGFCMPKFSPPQGLDKAGPAGNSSQNMKVFVEGRVPGGSDESQTSDY